ELFPRIGGIARDLQQDVGDRSHGRRGVLSNRSGLPPFGAVVLGVRGRDERTRRRESAVELVRRFWDRRRHCAGGVVVGRVSALLPAFGEGEETRKRQAGLDAGVWSPEFVGSNSPLVGGEVGEVPGVGEGGENVLLCSAILAIRNAEALSVSSGANASAS